jgi:phosphohistidine phosphatase SixA
VRHAEKESQAPNMTSDVALSEKGKERAEALKELLQDKNIGYIFSTNTIRTKTTAEPLSNFLGIQIETYKPIPDSVFISRLKSLQKNSLIVGHSNTVDDIVNKLCNENKLQDLQDSEYDNLFIIKKKGSRFVFSREKYGKSE